MKLIRTNRLKDGVSAPAAVAPDVKTVNMSKTDIADWQTLVGDGSVRSLRMTVGEVSERFRQANHADAADRPETPQANDRFIDLYIAPVSVPAIGKSLLGESGYQRLASRLKPGQSAVLVAGDGAYSFKGSGYVRGGIFDRIELLQDGQGLRFRDRDHTRLPTLAAQGAPRLRDIALFTIPVDSAFEVTEPFELQLLVQRSINTHDKAVIPYTLGYNLPSSYVNVEKGRGCHAGSGNSA